MPDWAFGHFAILRSGWFGRASLALAVPTPRIPRRHSASTGRPRVFQVVRSHGDAVGPPAGRGRLQVGVDTARLTPEPGADTRYLTEWRSKPCRLYLGVGIATRWAFKWVHRLRYSSSTFEFPWRLRKRCRRSDLLTLTCVDDTRLHGPSRREMAFKGFQGR